MSEPSEDFHLHQDNQDSCGVYLLIQALAYINREQHKFIPQNKIGCYGHQRREDMLRQAESIFDDSMFDVSKNHFHITYNAYLFLICRYPIPSYRTQSNPYQRQRQH